MSRPEPSSPPRQGGVETMRALAHPTRLRMLELLRQEPLSASELARRLEIRFGSARFHLQQLVRGGLAHPAGDRRVQGGLELLFSAPEDLWVDIDPADPATTSAMHRALIVELRPPTPGGGEGSATRRLRRRRRLLRQVRLTPTGREEAERSRRKRSSDPRAGHRGRGRRHGARHAGLFLFRTPRPRKPERRSDPA